MKKIFILLLTLGCTVTSSATLKTYTIQEGQFINEVIPYEDYSDLDSMKLIGSLSNNAVSEITGICRRDGRLRYVDLSETTGLTEIGESCFEQVPVLRTLILPQSVTSIGDYAFYRASSLEEVNLPDNINYIGQFAFSNCVNLKGTPLPAALQTIGSCAFENCRAFGPDVVIPKNVSSIGAGVFSYMDNVKTLTVEEGNSYYKAEGNLLYTSDGKMLLAAACGLEGNVSVAEGTVEILPNIFAGSEMIKEISLPASLIAIGDAVFSFAYGLESIKVDEGNEMFSSADGVLFNKDKSVLMTYPMNRAAEEYHTPASVTVIEQVAFVYNKNLKKVYLNEGLKEIKDYGFDETASLEYVSLPQTLETLGTQVFGYNKLLDNVEVPSGIILIPDNTFAECSGLKNITLPEDVTLIGVSAFFGCTSLENITLPTNLLTICTGAFMNSGLKSISIPEGMRSLDASVFYNSPDLSTVVLPSTLTDLGNYCFGGTTLTSVTCNAVTPPAADYAFMFADLDNAELTVPAESVDAYKAAEGWKNFFNITSDVKNVISNTYAPGTDTYYDAQGRKLNAMKRGLNIVKGSDGSTRKVMMK